jgi:hypothetical protein
MVLQAEDREERAIWLAELGPACKDNPEDNPEEPGVPPRGQSDQEVSVAPATRSPRLITVHA